SSSWDFGDGSTSGLQNPVHIYSQAGTYVVSLTVVTADGCQSTSAQTITLSISGITQVTTEGVSISAGRGHLNLLVKDDLEKELLVKVYDVVGRELTSYNVMRKGVHSIQLPGVSNAVVMVMLESGGETQTRRLFVPE
ncbi:MAG: PKD domain-containing protein, partial [Flavobacteriales bacterium]